jgi:hypothetical protein
MANYDFEVIDLRTKISNMATLLDEAYKEIERLKTSK